MNKYVMATLVSIQVTRSHLDLAALQASSVLPLVALQDSGQAEKIGQAVETINQVSLWLSVWEQNLLDKSGD